MAVLGRGCAGRDLEQAQRAARRVAKRDLMPPDARSEAPPRDVVQPGAQDGDERRRHVALPRDGARRINVGFGRAQRDDRSRACERRRLQIVEQDRADVLHRGEFGAA